MEFAPAGAAGARDVAREVFPGCPLTLRLAEALRLAAAKAERARHRADQVARHEIVIVLHIDTLVLAAEPAWRAALQVDRAHQPTAGVTACFVPRARRWEAGWPGK